MSTSGRRSRTADMLREIDRICDQYEAARKDGSRPLLSDYVDRIGSEGQRILLQELLAIDVEYRLSSGELPCSEDYRDLADDIELLLQNVIERAQAEFTVAQAIEDPDVTLKAAHANTIAVGSQAAGVPGTPDAGSKASAVAGSRMLGKFRLLCQLGQGGFGTVWKAEDTELVRLVALKLPRYPLLDGAERERFFREARAAAQLQHPGIVRLLDADQIDGQVYITSEYIDGVTLKEWLQSHRPTPRESIRMAHPIAEALAYAHHQQVVHRDIKPTNILLDHESNPLLGDFGLARRLTGEETLTVEDQVLGSPGYMSPEQARGKSHEADHRSDIYSLGVVMFEMLTGELPFRGEMSVVLRRIVEEDVPSPRQLNPAIPRDLETIVLKCLERDPAQRYQTADEVGDELGRFLSGRPIAARPIGRINRSWRWCKRHRLVAAAAVVLTASTIVAGVLAVTAHRESLRARSAERSAEQRAREYERLAHSVEAQVALDKGLLREAFDKITAAMKIKPSWQYERILAQIVEQSRKDWALVSHLVCDQPPARAAFVPTSPNLLLVETSDHRNLRLFDLQTSSSISSAEFDAEISRWVPMSSGTVAVVCSDGKLRTLELPDLTLAKEIRFEGSVLYLACSPQGDKFAVGELNGKTTIFATETLEQITAHTFPLAKLARFRRFMQAAFSPSGKQVVLTNGEWTARPWLWNLETDEIIRLPFMQQHTVHFFDERRMLGIYTISDASDMIDFHIYPAKSELQPGERKTKYFPGNARGKAHVWLAEPETPDQTDEDSHFRAAIFGDDAVSTIDGWSTADTSRIEHTALLPHRTGPVEALDLIPAGPTFAISVGNEIYVFRRRSMEPVEIAAKITMPTRFWSMALSGNSVFTPRQYLSVSENSELVLSELNLVYPVSPEDHPLEPWGMAVTPDERTLAILFQENSGGGTISATYYGKIVAVYELVDQPRNDSPTPRYRLSNSFRLSSFDGTEGRSNSGISITPDGSRILYTSYENRACVYDAATGQPLHLLEVGNKTRHARNSRFLAHGSYTDAAPVTIVDVGAGKEVATTEVRGRLRTLCFDRQTEELAVGWQEQPADRLDVFRVADGKLLRSVQTFLSPVSMHPRYDEYAGFRAQTIAVGTSVLAEASTGRLLEELDDGIHVLAASGFTGNGSLLALPVRSEVTVYRGIAETEARMLLDRCEHDLLVQ